MTLHFDLLMSLICNNINVWSYVSGQTESSLFVEVKNAKVLKNALSLRICLSYIDDSFSYTLSLPSQFLALSAHGPECHIEHVGGLLISNSRIQRLLLASIDIHVLSE